MSGERGDEGGYEIYVNTFDKEGGWDDIFWL